MKEQEFLEKLRTLKEQAVLQGGYVEEAQIEESFPGLDEKQKALLSTYFKENHIGIGEALPEEELLSPEEGELFRIYMDELAAMEEIDESLKRVLVMNALAGDRTARERLTGSYLRSVVDMARLYTGQGVELGDLVGEGNVALAAAMSMLESIETPDDCDAMVSRSVMNAMEELIRAENEETEAFERSMLLVMRVMGKAKELSEELRRKVSVAELLDEGDMSEEELRHALRLSKDLQEYIAL